MKPIFSVAGTNGGGGLQRERGRRLDVYTDHVAFVDEQDHAGNFEAPRVLGFQEIKTVTFTFPKTGFFDKAPGSLIITPKSLGKIAEGGALGIAQSVNNVVSESGFGGFLGGIQKVGAMFTHAIYYTDQGINQKVEEVCNYMREKIQLSHVAKMELSVQATPSTQRDVSAELSKLAELKDKGILTDDEFSNAKRKLLDSL